MKYLKILTFAKLWTVVVDMLFKQHDACADSRNVDLCSKNDWYQLCILTQVSLTPVQALLMCTTKFSALRIVLSSFAVHINGRVSFVLACSMGGATMAVWATAGRWRRATQWKCPSTCCRPRPAAAPTGSGRLSTWLVAGGTPWLLRSGQRPPTDHLNPDMRANLRLSSLLYNYYSVRGISISYATLGIIKSIFCMSLIWQGTK